MSYYDEWRDKTFLLPQFIVFVIYSVFGFVTLLLDYYQPECWKKRAVNTEYKKLSFRFVPNYMHLISNLIPNFLLINILGYLILQVSPTHLELSVFYEKNTYDVLKKLGITFLIEEGWFYVLHRIFHIPYLYRKFHHIHHEAAQPYSWTTNYCHWVEELVVNLPSVALGVIWTQMSWWLACIWYSFITFRNMVYHSGHKIIFDPTHHDEHHRTKTNNYALTPCIDKFFGTYA